MLKTFTQESLNTCPINISRSFQKIPYYKLIRKLYVIWDDDIDINIYVTRENEIYEALAGEYKLKESEEVMDKKVKLPKFMCDCLKGCKARYPATALTIIDQIADQSSEANKWLVDSANQWKLIDALRYGYEPEPEPRWGIKAGNCYMDNTIEWQFDRVTPDFIIDDELAYFTNKDKADDMVETLGFGEVVDLNKEGIADD